MTDGLLPPFADPGGPAYDDGALVVAFLRHEPAGHSARFHIEGPVLLADREVPAALILGPSVVLVRRDLPDGPEDARTTIERALASEDLSLLDPETPLAVPVALQIVGLRLSSWDLWGTDLDEAFAAVRRVAVGESALP